ncbi:MAG: FAD-dependent oxidoreductase [Pseudomonadota bacterium]
MVIGAGSAGLVSAYIGAAVKAKVILIENAKMGGDCLNTGCVPSKSLIATAKLLHNIKHSDRWGIHTASAEYDFADVMNRVQSIIKTIEPHDSVERYTGLGVEVIQGYGKIMSPTEVEVNGRTITTRNIILATGARPFVPPIEGLDVVEYLTSDNIWELKALPRRMVVLGGGPIGCELAQCFNRLGSEVTIVEMLPQIMIREDTEIAEFMANRFSEEGIQLLTDHKAVKVTKGESGHILHCEKNGAAVDVEFDAILVAVGRAARSEGYGLQEVKIPLTQRRTIETNEYLQAGYPTVYACGDIVGPYQFTHVAAHQAWYACVNALFNPFKKFKVDYSVIPWATYTDPEVARVGLNELEAKEKGIAYDVTRYELSALDRALADGHAEGVVKVLTVPGKDKILGATILGAHGGDLIAEFVLAMKHGLGMNKLLGTIHAYPTWMEANKFAAGNWKRANAPEWALGILQKFHRWRRR